MEAISDFFSGIFDGSMSDVIIKIAVAIAILVLGVLLARLLTGWLRKTLVRSKVDKTLISFFCNVFYYSLLVVVVVIAMSYLGVPTSSLAAVLGAATLAIGLALQDSISNLASGISIVALRPLAVGDYVEIADKEGFVVEIRLFHTLLTTRDNKSVYIPNKDVMGNNIVNYSDTELIRVELVYGISYGDDVHLAKRILEQIVAEDERIAKQPPTVVAVKELGDNSVNLTVRPYVAVEDEPDVTFSITEQVKLRFDEAGLSIPFPQRDIHLVQAS